MQRYFQGDMPIDSRRSLRSCRTSDGTFNRFNLQICALVVAALVLAAPVARVEAQVQSSMEKSVTVPRVSKPPIIDGVSSSSEWAEAVVIDDLLQVRPVEFAQPSDRTRVWVMYDDDAVYIAAKMWDREPHRVTANILRQGEDLDDDDSFAVVLDTFRDHRSGYWFEMNPNGVRQQAIFENVTERNPNWRGIWRGMARRDADGWTAEMAIPVKTLSFDPSSGRWGINFRRKIERRGEFMGWISRNSQVTPSATGTATGLIGLDQGRGLDITPAVTLNHRRNYNPRTDASEAEPSLDLFYKVTSAMTAALTLNTDFSATEVDDREVNLTRFSLFFPEKRAFFLQDADIFDFGRLTSTGNETEISDSSIENGRPFFSRRIGLSQDGSAVDLRAGGKLTGRVGRWNVGLLDVQQAAYGDVSARNLLVGRVYANVLEESTVGLLVTHGDPRSENSNSLVGVDARFRNSQLFDGNTLEAESWYQRTETEGLVGNDAAYGAGVRLANEVGLRAGVRMKELQANFNPALGFVNNTGIRDYTGELRYTHRRDGFLKDIVGSVDVQRVELLEGGDLQSQTIAFRPLLIETSTNDLVELTYSTSKEVLYEPFELSDSVVLAPGEYSSDDYQLALETGGQRVLASELRLGYGDFFSGKRRRAETEVTWRPSPHLAISGEYEYADIDLPEGNLIVRLVQLRTDVVFSSTLAWSTLVQYDNESELTGVNSRLHWIPQAGRETFLVLNYGLQDYDRDNHFDAELADLALKVGYTFRF